MATASHLSLPRDLDQTGCELICFKPVSAAAAVNHGLVTHFVSGSPHPAVPGVPASGSLSNVIEGAHLAHSQFTPLLNNQVMQVPQRFSVK